MFNLCSAPSFLDIPYLFELALVDLYLFSIHFFRPFFLVCWNIPLGVLYEFLLLSFYPVYHVYFAISYYISKNNNMQ